MQNSYKIGDRVRVKGNVLDPNKFQNEGFQGLPVIDPNGADVILEGVVISLLADDQVKAISVEKSINCNNVGTITNVHKLDSLSIELLADTHDKD